MKITDVFAHAHSRKNRRTGALLSGVGGNGGLTAMTEKAKFAAWSVFAGICVSLFLLCRLRITLPAEPYSAIHSAGYWGIPLVLGGCGFVFARKLLGWKNRLLSGLTLVVVQGIIGSAGFVSAGLVQELLRLTRLSSSVLVHLPGMDVAVLHPCLFGVLAGVSTGMYSFLALITIRRCTFRSIQ